MLDQSFSANNFRRILELENRKGIYLEGRFFPDIAKMSEKIKESTDEEERINLIKEKNDKLKIILEEVSKKVASSDFRIELKKKIINGKFVYITKNIPECFFAIKQLQRNIYRLYNVKQANRNEIISQIINLLGDKFPKYIVKVDLHNFYENIPQKKILQKIHDENLLTPLSKKIVRNILDRYKELSGNKKGIPRGVGVSAYLSELFMKDVDNDIKYMKDLIYYARYVDDMIVIFSPNTNWQNRDYFSEIQEIIEKKHYLILNKEKSRPIDLLNLNIQHLCKLEYLGYKISFGTGNVKTELTEKKFNKYKKRISLSINHYLNFSKINEKKARKLFEKRIRFLTGNTRLTNNKKNILAGIYYSNLHLTESKILEKLDKYLKEQINNLITMPKLREKLQKYSFVEGFETKRFSPFKSSELREMMKIWK